MKHLIKIALFLTTITLFACGGSSGGGDPETPAGGGTPPAPTETDLSIADAGGNEGENITFTVTSTPNIAKAISFRYQVNFTGTAIPSDLAGDTSGDITIATNDSNATISIAIFDDNFKEPAETFQIMLSNLSTSSADFTQNTAIGTIAESDPNGEIPITITDQSAAEGSSLKFKVTAGVTTTEAIRFAYTIDFAGQTATASDLGSGQQLTGRETIATGDSSTTISIGIAEDTQTEPDETFRITLNDLTPSNATFDFDNRGIAIGKILASDPQISISDATSSSESKITFTVTSTQAIAENISFSYNLVFDNPLTLNSASTSDFSSGSTSGEETITAGENSTTIVIDLTNDIYKESAENFQIQLSELTPTEATFAKSTATGTIASSDSEGVKTEIRISDGNPIEAGEGENIIFTVTSAFAIAEQIGFNYQLVFNKPLTSKSANASDFEATSGSGTIATNELSTTISIAIKDDTLREEAETFMVRLSNPSPNDATFGDSVGIGTILDNDPTGIVIISVADATASEASGKIDFQVTSAFSASSQITFEYEAIFGSLATATARDLTGDTSGQATIDVGNTRTTISISLTQDATAEPDETFRLLLTNLSNATLDSLDITNNYSATGTILNDDLGEITLNPATTGDSRITLNWTNPGSNLSDLFAGVTIARIAGSTAPAENCSSGTTTNIGKVISHTITGLTNGTPYSFRICARSNTDSFSSGAILENQIPDVDNDGDNVYDSIDVDDDNDGLIEIFDATGLNNIRHNLDGDGYITSNGGSANTDGCPSPSGCNGYELANDIIDLSSDYSPWIPIGISTAFTATFDGNNNTISGLRISSGSIIGLFSSLNNATVRNLKLATVSITGNGNVGALVGQATGTTTLSNIELIGDANQTASNPEIAGTEANVGGLVGDFSGTIIDAYSSLTIRGESSNTANNTGGLVGLFQSGTIKSSNSSGSVYSSGGGNDSYGGLVGQSGGAISNSWASGNVSSNGNFNLRYGGLVGQNDATISNSWASGNVFSNNMFDNNTYGGLVGGNNGAISNSWASGEVISNNSLAIGGLVGGNGGTISNSWASGEVPGSNVGGLVGNNSFRIPISGITVSGNINGRNYQLDDATGAATIGTNSFHLASTADLASLSGASGSDATNSGWHAGFGSDPNANTTLLTRFCDTDGSGSIETSERRDDNTVWVMAGGDPSNDLPEQPTENEAGGNQNYYRIPAIRCIANTESTTDTAEIYRLRKIEIDRQRRLFPNP